MKQEKYFDINLEEYVERTVMAYHEAFGCEYREQCTICAGHIDDPGSCARYRAVVVVGIDTVPEGMGPIDNQRAQMIIENARQ